MAHPRRFRFGIQLIDARRRAAEWAALARKAEDLGYSTLFMPDHFGDQLAPVPALMAAADATTELKVGALVFDNDYKHPVVLAKELATIDVLSGGRLEVGIGAGWMQQRLRPVGHPHGSARRAGVRMEEGIAVIKGCFADGPFSFEGEHYTITDYDGLPKPSRRPRRSSSAAAPSGCCRSPAARPRSSGINPSIHSGQVDAAAAQNGAADGDRPEARVGEGGRRRPLRRPRDQHAAVRRHRHRRPQGHRRDDGAAVRPADPRSSTPTPTPASAPSRRSSSRSRPGGSAGTCPTSCSRATRWRRSHPSSPPCATPEPRWPTSVDLAFAGSRVDRRGPRLRRRPRPGPARSPSVASRDPQRAAAAAARVGARPCGYDELPAGADGVVVCTPPALHAAQALARRGRPAPPCSWRSRCAPPWPRPTELVAAGEAGAGSPTPRTSCTRRSSGSPSLTPPSSRHRPLDVRAVQRRPTWGDFLTEGWGGGVLFDLGVHPLAVALLLAAPAGPSRCGPSSSGADDHPVDEHAEVASPLRHGPRGPGRGQLARRRHPDVGRAGVVARRRGPHGAAPDLLLERNGTEVRLPGIPEGVPPQLEELGYIRQIESFALDIATGRTPELGAAFGRSILDVVCAAYASAADGRAGSICPSPARDRTPLQIWRDRSSSGAPVRFDRMPRGRQDTASCAAVRAPVAVGAHPAPARSPSSVVGAALFSVMAVGGTDRARPGHRRRPRPGVRRAASSRGTVALGAAAIVAASLLRMVGVVLRRYFGQMAQRRMQVHWFTPRDRPLPHVPLRGSTSTRPASCSPTPTPTASGRRWPCSRCRSRSAWS